MVLLQIVYNTGNSGLTCAPLCLTDAGSSLNKLPSTVLDSCPTLQDDGLCALVAATNISMINNYDEWSCTTMGFTSTDPCMTGWTGVSCTSNVVTGLLLDSIGIVGMCRIIMYCIF